MPRPPRADEAETYYALNRGNLRATIFHKVTDYQAFAIEALVRQFLDDARKSLATGSP